MTDRIKAHLNTLLQDAPKTRRVEEMKQELLAGCLDKYADLTDGGMSPEEAYNEVINGIGDVEELLGHIERADAFNPADAESKRKKRAFFISCGICGYFLSIAVVTLFVFMEMEIVGAAIMLFLMGVSSMLIVYGVMTTGVSYEKQGDTLVEELKVQMAQGANSREKKLAGLASSSMWSLIVVIYFLVSFLWGHWHLTWMLFLAGAALQCCITAWYYPKSRAKSLTGAAWCLVVIAYISLSFATFAWHITWIIFPLAAALQQAAKLFIAWRDEQ